VDRCRPPATKLARRGRDGPRDDGRSSAARPTRRWPCGRALAAAGSEVMRIGRLATTDEAWLLSDRAKVQSGRPRCRYCLLQDSSVSRGVHILVPSHPRQRLRTRSGRLAIGPVFEICNRKAFKKWVGFNDLLSIGSARCVGAGHN
jgi:hypothetical protein